MNIPNDTLVDNVIFVTHADVVIDPHTPVPAWSLSETGRSKHERFNDILLEKRVSGIYCSDEKKAIDGAEIHSSALHIEYVTDLTLREHDRSSTGFVEPLKFRQMSETFFAHPDESLEGWETARAAQTRVVHGVLNILRMHHAAGNIVIVSHGGVAALLLCALSQVEITKSLDQQDNGGGNYFTFNARDLNLIHDWHEISA